MTTETAILCVVGAANVGAWATLGLMFYAGRRRAILRSLAILCWFVAAAFLVSASAAWFEWDLPYLRPGVWAAVLGWACVVIAKVIGSQDK